MVGFGGVFDLVETGFTFPPTLIEGTAGVGTKLKFAHAKGKHDAIGIELVAMSVNDLVVHSWIRTAVVSWMLKLMLRKW